MEHLKSQDKIKTTALHGKDEKRILIKVAKFLIQNGAKVNVQNRENETALHASINNLKIAKLLIQHGANVNIKDKKGNTPLHWAIGMDHLGVTDIKVVKLLVEKGANIKAGNNKGETLLDIAKKKSNKKIIELFKNK